jgi:hypothetical protein
MLPLAKAAFVLQVATLAAGAADPAAYVSAEVPHPGSDQIFWVPTLAQAEVAARETGRMILVMGSVGDWNGF